MQVFLTFFHVYFYHVYLFHDLYLVTVSIIRSVTRMAEHLSLCLLLRLSIFYGEVPWQ